MARTYLRDLTDWKLSDSNQDVRGWTLRTSDGRPLGRIQHMVADTETEHVESVILEDGTEYPIENLQIGDGDVILHGTARPATTHKQARDTDPAVHDFTGEERGFRIPIVEEKVEVGKRTVQKGGARVRSEVKERPVEETVNLKETKVHVDRQKTDRPASMSDFEQARGSFELQETAEEPVVEKSARVKEEVVINKEVRNRNEKIRETERRTDVDVEPIKGEQHRHSDPGKKR